MAKATVADEKQLQAEGFKIPTQGKDELAQLKAEGFKMGDPTFGSILTSIFGDTKDAPRSQEGSQAESPPLPKQAVKEQTQSPYEQLAAPWPPNT